MPHRALDCYAAAADFVTVCVERFRASRCTADLVPDARKAEMKRCQCRCWLRLVGDVFTLQNRRELAEREGFEPPLGCPKPDFESGAFDHSAISPRAGIISDQYVAGKRPRSGTAG